MPIPLSINKMHRVCRKKQYILNKSNMVTGKHKTHVIYGHHIITHTHTLANNLSTNRGIRASLPEQRPHSNAFLQNFNCP